MYYTLIGKQFPFFTTSGLAHHDNTLTSHAVSHISSLLPKLDTNTYIALSKSQVLQVGLMSKTINKSLLHYVLGMNTFPNQSFQAAFPHSLYLACTSYYSMCIFNVFSPSGFCSYSLCLLSSATSTYEHYLKPSSDDLISMSIYLILI